MAAGNIGWEDKKMQKKKLLLLAGAGLLAGVTAIGINALSAYLRDSESKVNQTIVGGNHIEIVEEFIPPNEMTPGAVIHKDVSIKNTGPSPCYVRISALFSNSDVEKYCTVDWNTDDYFYEDGYFYYEYPLEPGEQSPSLMTTINVSDALPKNEITAVSLIVYAESYQSEGFMNYIEAWEHCERNEP
jgi:hypothetical protein